MLRVLVLLLVGPSLLMPPGVCVCRFAHEGPPAPTQRGTPPVGRDVAAAAPGRCHGCCGGRPARHDAPRSGEDRPKSPAKQHPPGCPASGATPAAESTAPESTVLAGLAESQACPFPTTAAVERPPAGCCPLVPSRTSAAPPYITFRALLI